MTTIDRFDPFARRITDALDEIAAARTPDYLDSVLQQTARSRQRPGWAFPERWLPVNRLTLAAAAAAVMVAVLGGAVLLSRSNAPSVGASPSPTIASSSSTAPSPTLPVGAAAQALWGDWVADAQLGLPNQEPRIQFSIGWGDGRDIWLITGYSNGGPHMFDSQALDAPDGQLRMVSKAAADGCQAGDVGTYAWSRPGDGFFMTLTPVADACAARSNVLGRTWVHTLSAVTDGGHGVLPADNLEMTLPNRRFGLAYKANGPYDRTWDTTPFIEFLAIKDPVPFKAPCASPLETATPLTAADKLVTYVKSLPGFTFTSAAGSIDGHPATHLTGTPKSGYSCRSGDRGFFSGNDNDWTISNDNAQALSVWVTENGPDAYLFWYRGDGVTAADEAAVIASIHFITALPPS